MDRKKLKKNGFPFFSLQISFSTYQISTKNRPNLYLSPVKIWYYNSEIFKEKNKKQIFVRFERFFGFVNFFEFCNKVCISVLNKRS